MSLPDTLHELIGLALDELRAVEQTPGYVVDMSTWVQHQETTGLCSVCLAGAVVRNHPAVQEALNRQKVSRLFDGFKFVSPTGTFSKEPKITNSMLALDDLRTGHMRNAARIFYDDDRGDDLPEYQRITHYDEDRDEFYFDMGELQAALKEVNL